ncbi:MAG: hypothetical protein Kow0099_23410 [Candidatus Abyssubacteria bacterium]
MKDEKYHTIDIEQNIAHVNIDVAYLPLIEQQEYVLLSHYIDLLNDVARLNALDDLKITVFVHGKPTDEDLLEVERQMRKDLDSLALHQDELLHIGLLSNVLDFAWLAGCVAILTLKPLLFPLVLPYMIYNVLHTYARAKKLLVAEKFKDCARELSNNLKTVQGEGPVAERVNRIIDYFERLDGSPQDIYLKLAAKADEEQLQSIQRYYYHQFDSNKPRRGLFRNVLHLVKLLFSDEDATRIKVPDRRSRKTSILKESHQRRSIEFIVLPTKEAYEIYLADEFTDGELLPVSLIPPALHPIAHMISESDVEIDNLIRAPVKLDLEEIRSKLSQSLYITTYSRRKFEAMKLGQLVSFEKRQIPIILIVIGVLDSVFGLFKGSLFVSPILLFGIGTLIASLLLSRSVKKHFSAIASGFDKIFEDFLHPSLIVDKKLAELNDLVKNSNNLVDAYTETFHRALEFGWNGIADLYQSKAVFHQREFKEPGECIMRVER